MSTRDIEKRHHQTFEEIKQLGHDGAEFWMARQLGKILDYAEYRNFLPVIDKAKKACSNSGQPVADHFVEMHEMVFASLSGVCQENGLCGRISK